MKNQIRFKVANNYEPNTFKYSTCTHNTYNTYNELLFEASNEQAFVYAVYDFLERFLGCRLSSYNNDTKNPVALDFYLVLLDFIFDLAFQLQLFLLFLLVIYIFY